MAIAGGRDHLVGLVLLLLAVLVDCWATAEAVDVAHASADVLHLALQELYDRRDMVGLREASEAVIALRPEVAVAPGHRSAQQYLGTAHYALGDIEKAADAFECAVRANESDRSSWIDLGNIYLFQMRMAEAAAALEVGVLRLGASRDTHVLYKARNWMADWRDRDEMLDQIARTVDDAVREGFHPFMNPATFVELPIETLKKLIRHDYTDTLPGVSPPMHCTTESCLRLKSPELRVGFVSSDFGIHPVSTLIRGMLAALSSPEHQVTVFCFPLTDKTSWWKQNISQTVDYTISLKGKNSKAAAETIRSHDIHVLIDLNGHTVHSGLGIFQFRPAPVQIAYLGYPMTTGTDYMDFVVADQVATPPDMTSDLFTEKKLLLPTHYIVNDYMQMFGHAFGGQRPMLPLSTMPSDGETPFVFATFSNWQKIDPPVFKAWMEVLARVPSSVMWFIRYSGHEDAERLLRAEANSYGIDGSSRLVFTELRPWIDHIGAKRAADLILDTSLKNGHTTILDALCAGVPVISLEGEHMSNRAGSSALYTLDLDVLTVNSLKEYVEVAVHVATHRHVYQRLRHLVEQRRLTSALFDTAKYTRNFDDAVRSAWEVKKLTILGGARMKHIFPSQVTRARALTPREFPIHSALTQVKDTQDYEARVQTTLDANADIKLRIGGQIAEPSWWIVDEDGGVHVDFVLGMENLYPFPDGSVSALYASHALERCDYGVTDGVERTLREWRRVLKPDGVLYVSVPNLLALSSLYANASTSTEERVFLMGLMFGGQTDARDVHKVGLDEDILGVFLSSAGFCNFTRVDSFDLFPDSSAMVSGMPVRLNMLAQPCPP